MDAELHAVGGNGSRRKRLTHVSSQEQRCHVHEEGLWVGSCSLASPCLRNLSSTLWFSGFFSCGTSGAHTSFIWGTLPMWPSTRLAWHRAACPFVGVLGRRVKDSLRRVRPLECREAGDQVSVNVRQRSRSGFASTELSQQSTDRDHC